jgi:hypothetical protein
MFLKVDLGICLFLLNTVSWIKAIQNHIFRWSLSTYILWLRVLGNMPSGIRHYWSIYMYINKQCSRVNTLQIWIQMWHKQTQKIFSAWAEILTRISRIYKTVMTSQDIWKPEIKIYWYLNIKPWSKIQKICSVIKWSTSLYHSVIHTRL